MIWTVGFTRLLGEILTGTGTLERVVWLAELHVSEEDFGLWLDGKGIPTPEQLLKLVQLARKDPRVANPVRDLLGELLNEKMSGIGIVWDYILIPVHREFRLRLRELSPALQEKILWDALRAAHAAGAQK